MSTDPLDALLSDVDHIDDDGFSSRVMHALPKAHPAWPRLLLLASALLVGIGLAVIISGGYLATSLASLAAPWALSPELLAAVGVCVVLAASGFYFAWGEA